MAAQLTGFALCSLLAWSFEERKLRNVGVAVELDRRAGTAGVLAC